MKNLSLLALAFFFPLLLSAAVECLDGASPSPSQQTIYGVRISDNIRLSPEDVLQNSEHMERVLNKKLTLKQKIVLKIAKHKLKKAARKGQLEQAWSEIEGDDDTNFWLGFILGLLLGLLGMLIAVFFGRDALQGALYGFLIWILILLLVASEE